VTAISPRLPRNPKSVPRYALVPWRSKTKEFGVAGRVTDVPTVFAGAVIGTSVLKQPVVVVQSPEEDTPVLDTYMVSAAEVVVAVAAGATTTSTALSG
jgi:hypothetical protein